MRQPPAAGERALAGEAEDLTGQDEVGVAGLDESDSRYYLRKAASNGLLLGSLELSDGGTRFIADDSGDVWITQVPGESVAIAVTKVDGSTLLPLASYRVGGSEEPTDAIAANGHLWVVTHGSSGAILTRV